MPINIRTKPEALITTPAEATICPTHGETGVRYTGDAPGRTFAHCKVCGSTDLYDSRSPFEVLAEAIVNADAPDLAVETRWGRQDVVARVARFAADTPVNHCGDCADWSRRPAVRRALDGFRQV